MTYIEPYHTWATGEELTPERLNGNANAILDGLTDGTKDLNLNKVTSPLGGNADTATAFETARNITLTGEITGGPTSYDGTGTTAIATTSKISHSCTVCSGFRDSMRALFDDANSNAAILADATAQAMMLQAIKSYNSAIAGSYADEIVPLNAYLTANHSYTWSAPQLSIFNDSNILNSIPGNLEASDNMYLYDVVKKGAIAVGFEPYYELTFADVSTSVVPSTFMTKNIQISYTCFPYDMVIPGDADFVDCLLEQARDSTSGQEYIRGCITPNMSITGFWNSSNNYTTKLQVWFTQKYWDSTNDIWVTRNARRPESFTVRVRS